MIREGQGFVKSGRSSSPYLWWVACACACGVLFAFLRATPEETRNLRATPEETRYLCFQVQSGLDGWAGPRVRSGRLSLDKEQMNEFVRSLTKSIGMVGDARRKLAFAVGPLCLDMSDEETRQFIRDAFSVARENDVAVFLHVDDSMAWGRRRELVSDPANLDMKLWVGDELRQSANTRDLVLDIPGMIETASAVMTLYPGDIIATGTPEGVGPVVDGDVIRIVIDQVGEMNVPVVQGNRGMTEVFAQPYVPPIIKQN